MTQKVNMLINGEMVTSQSQERIPVTNLVTQVIIPKMSNVTPEDVDYYAAAKAHAAFNTWKAVAVSERARVMLRYQYGH